MAKPAFQLRPALGEDVVPYTTFLADPDVTVWLDDTAQMPLSAARVEAILLHDAWCLWSIDYEGQFAGVTSLYEPDLQRRVARFSIVIGDKSAWGKGLGTEVTKQVVAHAFDTLALNKVNSDYLQPNSASAVIHERLGFEKEGLLRQDAWRQGRWVDRVVLSILADEWREPTK